MASRKVKHARMLEKREKFLEEERQRGLEAQRKGREEEARRKAAKERHLEEKRLEQKKSEDRDNLIAMMSLSMRRFPTDQEVYDFIMGDEATRESTLNSKHLEGSQ